MNDEEFNRLSTRYLEDELGEDGRDLLNRELLSSTDRIRQFNDLRMLAGLMLEHGRAEVDLPDVLASRQEKAQPRGWEWKRWGAAAAILMVGMFAGFLLSKSKQGERDEKALAPVASILMDIDFENATEGSIEGIPKVPGRWGGDPIELVSSANSDVPPKNGKSMACLTLPGISAPAPAEPKRAIHWHIVDLPEAERGKEPKVVELCVQFNRDAEVPNPESPCRIELYSFKGLPETAESQLKSEEYLAAAVNHFETDSDPQTWETARSKLQLSPDANFVLLGISGFADRISLPTGGQRFSGHYADGIQLILTNPNHN